MSQINRIEDKHGHISDPKRLAKVERIQMAFQAAFGHHLKASRVSAGLKQSDVAAQTGLPQQYLSLIEAGRQNITLKTMMLLTSVVDGDIRTMLQAVLDDLPEI